MSTVVATAPHVVTEPVAQETETVRARRTFAGVMRGEWIKLLSLRSTWWALGAATCGGTTGAVATTVLIGPPPSR